jgi:hypothetical protein
MFHSLKKKKKKKKDPLISLHKLRFIHCVDPENEMILYLLFLYFRKVVVACFIKEALHVLKQIELSLSNNGLQTKKNKTEIASGLIKIVRVKRQRHLRVTTAHSTRWIAELAPFIHCVDPEIK